MGGAVALLLGCLIAAPRLPPLGAQEQASVRRITWEDAAPLHAQLQARGLAADGFPAFVERIREANARRVREGDLDHLVFYLLQSAHFTPFPAIEPALGARALVESLDEREREAFLRSGEVAPSRIPAPVRSRLAALLRAVDSPDRDARLAYFRRLVTATFPDPGGREAAVLGEYLRVMRFVYEREFVAPRSDKGPAVVAGLYRTRGLSTDTAVEAGYVVYLGLGILGSLEPERRIRRVLIVGPGLDLAPRTALLDARPPESYQPWAVIDALLTLGLARADDLKVVAADINPRVVAHLRRARGAAPTLTLISEIQESAAVSLTAGYRDYFSRLGLGIGDSTPGTPPVGGTTGALSKTVRIRPEAARALRAEPLDIVTERLDGPAFDLVIATNILPYFDDVALILAMTNIGRMLAPRGVLLHNEARPFLGEVTDALGVVFEQSRYVTIATVRGAPPLFDSVWVHRKGGG